MPQCIEEMTGRTTVNGRGEKAVINCEKENRTPVKAVSYLH